MFVLIALTIPRIASGQKAPPSAEGGSLKVKIALRSREKLVLGKTDKAALQISVITRKSSQSAGTPARGCHIEMATNVGSFSEVKPREGGSYSVDYVLPSRFFPQYAIISATANCVQGIGSNWIVVPLYGTGHVLVKAKPGKDINLRVGDDLFGPVTPDRHGNAKIPIVVPPGFRYGQVGNQRISLDLPPVNRIAAAPDRKAVTAKTGKAGIYIYAIDSDGSALIKARLRVFAENGRIKQIKRIKRGVYRAIYLAPRSADAKEDVVTVELKNSPASKSKVLLKIGSEIPQQIQVTAFPENFKAGSDRAVTLKVRITDAQGDPTDGNVLIESDLGRSESIEQIATGVYRAALDLPNYFKSKKEVTVEITVTALTDPSKRIVKSHKIKLLPSTPAEIAVTRLSQKAPQSDGKSHVVLKAFVQDVFGNPVTQVNLEASAKHGRMLSEIPTGCNYYYLTYEAPKPPLFNRFEAADTITITPTTSEKPVQAHREIPLAKREFLFALELSAGYLSNFGNLHTPLIGAGADFSLWFLLRGFFASVEAGYMFDKEKSQDPQISSLLHGLPLYGSVGYRLRIKTLLTLFLKVGAGPHFVWYRMDRPAVPRIKKKTVLPSVRPVFGVGLDIGPGTALAALEYRWVEPVSFPEYKGSVGGLGLTLGYRYSF